MGDITFNISKAKVGYYWSLPATGDALVLVPLESSGLESDATLTDYDTLSALLAGASNEQTTIGRVTLTGATVTVNDTDDVVDLAADDATWSGASGNAIGAVVICYDPDGSGTDSAMIPLCKQDFVVPSPSGSLSATIDPGIRVS